MKISMILPIYNESSTIDGMMDQLRALPGDWEILFADGGSRDGTVQRIGTEFPVLKSPKGRAAQMNDGAARASGEILWFVHCDSRLPEDAHSQIQAAAEAGAAWGCFHIGFDYNGPFMGCNTFFSNRRPDGHCLWGPGHMDPQGAVPVPGRFSGASYYGGL